MHVFATMVMKDEESRYLGSSLAALVPQVDDVFVYDDRSIDGSVNMALNYTDHVVVRPEYSVPFLMDEGRFREEAWTAFQQEMQPAMGDWVLSVDADEIVVADGDVVDALRGLIDIAIEEGDVAVEFPIPEVFSCENGTLWVRQDGFWGTIKGVRLFRYAHNGCFARRAMGCGSVPTYVNGQPWLQNTEGVFILHFGYAREQDRQAKFERYSQREGHNPQHIHSIVQPPYLVQWDGPMPVLTTEF